MFAFTGLACSDLFPMTIGYGETTFPTIVELVAGWLIDTYHLGYTGALQRVVSLATVFRMTAVTVVDATGFALPVARHQRPSPAVSISTASATYF